MEQSPEQGRDEGRPLSTWTHEVQIRNLPRITQGQRAAERAPESKAQRKAGNSDQQGKEGGRETEIRGNQGALNPSKRCAGPGIHYMFPRGAPENTVRGFSKTEDQKNVYLGNESRCPGGSQWSGSCRQGRHTESEHYVFNS